MTLHSSLIFIFLGWSYLLTAQFTERSPMPEPVSNNAVVAARENGKSYIYSFCGMDQSKQGSGIHLKSWRYDVDSDNWMRLPDVPDPQGGKIAAAASFVNGLIYVTGGYHVATDGTETNSCKVHVFDPATNQWLLDATQIPVPVADHVQVVWRDSLIFVIGGWSGETNGSRVQVFDPKRNTWQAGTEVPNTGEFGVSGASGVVIGDTMYYAGGGGSGIDFSATSFFRIGVIDPEDPAQIRWSGFETDAARGYRMGAAVSNGQAVWMGGSLETYRYRGSEDVVPSGLLTVYDPSLNNFFQSTGNIPKVMDLRGIGQINENEVIIAGGMMEGQAVTDKVWLVQLDPQASAGTIEQGYDELSLFPNPAGEFVTVQLTGFFEVELYDEKGKLMLYQDGYETLKIPLGGLTDGIYWVNINASDGIREVEKIVVQR